MKKRTLNKLIYSTVALSMIGVSLSTSGIAIGSIVADAATSQVIADDTSSRSITIHKYDNLGEVLENPTFDDGENVIVSDGHKPVEGATFNLTQYKLKDGVSLNEARPVEVNSKGEVTSGGDFVKSETVSGTTGKDGSVKIDLGKGKNADGYWLVEETTDLDSEVFIDGTPTLVTSIITPFLVIVPQTSRGTQDKLIYDVNVNPKNELTQFNPVKYINTHGQNNHSVMAGEEFTWLYTDNIPEHLIMKNKLPDYFGISAYEDKGLLINGSANPTDEDLNAALTGYIYKTEEDFKTHKGELLEKDDYVATIDSSDKEFNLLNIEFTEKGIRKMAGTGKKSEYKYFEFDLVTKVDENFNGSIDNTFVTLFKPKDQPGIQIPSIPTFKPSRPTDPTSPTKPTRPTFPKPVKPTDPTSPVPEYWTGGFNLKKVDISNENKTLSGAEFKIATSKENAEKGIFIDARGGETDEDGLFSFNGLALNTDGATTVDDINQTYWLVETKAPDGYELIKEPIEVLVDTTTADKTNVIVVKDAKNTNLPMTGGKGMLVITAVGGTIVALGLGLRFKGQKKSR